MADAKGFTHEEIWYMDAGIFTLGDDNLRRIVCGIYAKIPIQVVNETMDNCLMVMPLAAEKGCFLPEELLKGKNLILLPEALFDEKPEDIEHTILHETAHFILKHTNTFLEPDVDWEAQEREANDLVQRWRKGTR